MSAWHFLLLFIQFDHIIDPQNSDSSLSCELNTLDLAHQRLQHSGLEIIPHLPIDQIQTTELEPLFIVEILRLRLLIIRIPKYGKPSV